MDIKNKIEKLIEENTVCLFMKGTRSSMWIFNGSRNILKHLNINFEGVNVLEDEALRQGIKDYSDWPTIPQLYVKREFIGGCDIIKELFEKGELKKIFKDKGVF